MADTSGDFTAADGFAYDRVGKAPLAPVRAA